MLVLVVLFVPTLVTSIGTYAYIKYAMVRKTSHDIKFAERDNDSKKSIISLKALVLILVTSTITVIATTLENLIPNTDPLERVPLSRILQPVIATLGLIYFMANAKVMEFLWRRCQWMGLSWDMTRIGARLWRPSRVAPMNTHNQLLCSSSRIIV
jgi:hypothetical protein